MNDLELDLKRKRIEWVVKILALLLVGFLVAPFIFIAIKGLIGMAIAAAVSFVVIMFIPWFAAVVANWRLKAIKHEAAKNPIETLQNNYNDRMQALTQFRDSIRNFAGEVRTFADKLEGYKRDYPQDSDKFNDQFNQMRVLLQQRKLKYEEAKSNLALYEKQIQRVSAEWDMAQAAAKMNKAAGVDADAFFAKIQVETAFDSVQKSLNSAFADLEVSLMDEKGQPPKPLPQVITDAPASQRVLVNRSQDPLDLGIEVEPAPGIVNRPKK